MSILYSVPLALTVAKVISALHKIPQFTLRTLGNIYRFVPISVEYIIIKNC